MKKPIWIPICKRPIIGIHICPLFPSFKDRENNRKFDFLFFLGVRGNETGNVYETMHMLFFYPIYIKIYKFKCIKTGHLKI